MKFKPLDIDGEKLSPQVGPPVVYTLIIIIKNISNKLIFKVFIETMKNITIQQFNIPISAKKSDADV
jgi:hypothetical protein